MSASLRAVIYARYSTELQHDKSVEDQIDLCRTYAAREGLEVVGTYADKAKSGASLIGRNDVMKMLSDANERTFDIIIVEALDRLSRDMEDLAGIHKRLTYLGIELRAVHEGTANTLMVGLRGLVGQLMREDNVHKIRRGMGGLVKQGLSAGGKAYGYKSDPENKGKRVIVPEQAGVIRRIYSEFAAGKSPRHIAHGLNRDGIRPPRGTKWNASTINGNPKRGYGILRNSLYAGRMVWNRVQMIKDPDTGNRVSRTNPPELWEYHDLPELRIVPPDLWDAAQAQLAAHAHGPREGNIGVHRRPKRLLSGLIKCGACGSGMTVYGHAKRSQRVRVRCSAHTNSGTCPDPQTYYLDEIEGWALFEITKQLSNPGQIMACARAYIQARRNQTAEPDRRRAEIEKDLAKISQKLDRFHDMIANDEGDRRTLNVNIKELVARRDELEQERGHLPVASNISFHPSAFRALGDRVKRLAEKWANSRAKFEYGLYELGDMKELGPVLRELIHSIVVTRNENGVMKLRIVGYLQPFIEEEGQAPRKAKGAVSLVAEEGLEPPTRGL